MHAVDVDASGSQSGTDTILAVHDAQGELLAADDDGGTTPLHSTVTYPPATAGTYYVPVAGCSDERPAVLAARTPVPWSSASRSSRSTRTTTPSRSARAT